MSKTKEAITVLPVACEALLTAAQIACAMGVSARQVHLMISAGKFPKCDLRIGRLARWKVSSYNAWLERSVRSGEE